MAILGRGGDTEMAHVTPGEIMIPPSVWEANPKLQESIRKAFLASGEDPAQFLAGSPLQKINPMTGKPEFFGGWIGKTINKVLRNPIVKAIAPVAAAFIPGVGPLLATAIGAGIGAYGGGGVTGAVTGGISGYGGSTLASGIRAVSQIPIAGANATPVANLAGGIKNLVNVAPGAWSTLGASSVPTNLGGFASAALKAAPLLVGLVSGSAAPTAPKQVAQVAPQNTLNVQQSSVPTNVPTASPTVPKGAGATSGIGLASAAPSGVSFLQPLKNRDTGQTGYTEAPFSTALSNVRRGSFGGAIFA